MSQKPSSTNVLLRCNNDVYNITGSRHEPLIRREERNEIRKKAQEFWDGKCSKSDFVGMAKGKEIGHRIADYVDEQTVQMLSSHFPCFHEVDKNGKKKPRSMGDVWIESTGVHNPVNVKSGQKGSNGQPNLVALGRLLQYLAHGYIDSYYLLFIKFETERDILKPHIHMVDLLETLAFTHFNSGPGQIMLKEKDFYDYVEAHGDEILCAGSMSAKQKASKLLAILEEGDMQLIKDREKRRSKLRRR